MIGRCSAASTRPTAASTTRSSRRGSTTAEGAVEIYVAAKPARGQARGREGRRHDEHVTRRRSREALQGRRRHGADPRQGRGSVRAERGEARKIARERRPNTALGGDLSTELALPRDFEAAAELVRDEDLDGSVVFGDDPGEWREKIAEFEEARFTHVGAAQRRRGSEGVHRVRRAVRVSGRTKARSGAAAVSG